MTLPEGVTWGRIVERFFAHAGFLLIFMTLFRLLALTDSARPWSDYLWTNLMIAGAVGLMGAYRLSTGKKYGPDFNSTTET